jgi:hypothetical protein
MKANLLKNLFTLISVVSLTSTVSAQVVLLGGFAGTSPTAIQSPSISNINVTLTSPTISGVPTDGFSQINNTLWGSTALDVVAPTIGNGDDSRKAVIQEGTNTPWTLILQITNNGTLDLSLNQIHFLTKKDINNAGPNSGSLTYSAGDLADSIGANTGFSIPNGSNIAFDISLSGFLTDTILSAGETASFTWAHGAPEDPLGNTGFRLDNFAISGTVIPEPSSFALIVLGLGSLVALRRRK